MLDSILTSVKKNLGIEETYIHFDDDIIMHINSVFLSLSQLGIASTTPFVISDKTATWQDLLADQVDKLAAVQTYIYLKVRLLFDPPTNSFIVEAMKHQILELEWRLNSEVDYVETTEEV